MSIDPQRTVAEIALEGPRSAAALEKLGIDYCCDGRKPLAAACGAAGIEVRHALDLLEAAAETNLPGQGAEGWRERSLASLMDYIVQKHHAYCRAECARLEPLAAKVRSKHGERHPELARIQEEISALRNELTVHMMKEERILFPYIIALEDSAGRHSPPPQAPFGTVQNPVRMMMQEHDGAGRAVKEIRRLTENFTPPEDACPSFKTLYQSLKMFEAELHQHIHLENNLLFPRAIEVEESAKSPR